jgi:outer membrane lipoprotein SlyB
MTTRPLKLLAALALLPLAGCVTTRTSSTTWGDDGDGAYGGEWDRTGRVAQIRETVQVQRGDPAAGAVAGAIVGGFIGSVLGAPHVDRWGRLHGGDGGAGAVAGAIGGAAIGAAASQGGAERRSYEVGVEFDDGGYEQYVYEGSVPFRPGDAVQLTPRGLFAY